MARSDWGLADGGWRQVAVDSWRDVGAGWAVTGGAWRVASVG